MAQFRLVSDPTAEFNRELTALEGDLKRLEAEYNMYFAGRLPRPPWETRKRVETHVKRIDRLHISNYGHRFKFNTLQGRLPASPAAPLRGLPCDVSRCCLLSCCSPRLPRP